MGKMRVQDGCEGGHTDKTRVERARRICMRDSIGDKLNSPVAYAGPSRFLYDECMDKEADNTYLFLYVSRFLYD